MGWDSIEDVILFSLWIWLKCTKFFNLKLPFSLNKIKNNDNNKNDKNDENNEKYILKNQFNFNYSDYQKLKLA
jgi:hypothetical protein